ncbi:O-antigen polymerase [Vibrio splendidus]|uniref:O-antigen polymerase n=1 Tax=Vibrio splendidus TaxID=29497 RepID=UPI003D0A091F
MMSLKLRTTDFSRKVIPFIILFLLVYPLKVKLLIPIHISLVLPALLFISNITVNKRDKTNIAILTFFVFIISFYVISLSIYHHTFDIGFIRYIVFQLFFVLSSIFVVYKYKLESRNVINIFLLVIFTDLILAIVFKLSPEIMSIVQYPFYISDINNEIYSSNLNTKFMGLGGQLFLGGVIAGYGVILSIYMYLNEGKKIYILTFLISFIYGFLLSRSIIIAIMLSLLLVAFYFIVQLRKGLINKRVILITTFSVFFLVNMVFFLFIFKDYNVFFQWAFEIIDTLIFSEGESNSINGLVGFYENFVTDQSMLILGNGIWSYSIESAGLDWVVDVGFLRVLYAFGLFMLVLYLAYNVVIFLFAYFASSDYLKRTLIFILFLYFIILSFKGFINVSVMISMLAVSFYYENTYENNGELGAK